MDTTADDSVITISHVKKSFPTLDVLCDISFSVRKGEVLGIIGPSGSGVGVIAGTVPGTVVRVGVSASTGVGVELFFFLLRKDRVLYRF